MNTTLLSLSKKALLITGILTILATTARADRATCRVESPRPSLYELYIEDDKEAFYVTQDINTFLDELTSLTKIGACRLAPAKCRLRKLKDYGGLISIFRGNVEFLGPVTTDDKGMYEYFRRFRELRICR